MAQLRIKIEGDQFGPKFKANLKTQGSRVVRSLQGAAEDFSAEFLKRGRADMARAGNFKSPRWQQGLFAKVTRGGANIVINVGHRVSYWMVFQRGAVIHGRPLLWIPLSFARDARGIRARDYPGGLFRVDRRNGLAPLLLSRATKKPKYFGRRSVRIPKKFRILEIGRETAKFISSFYNRRFRADRGR